MQLVLDIVWNLELIVKYGFVGVGCISFAESMLQYHQDGVERRVRIPTLYDEYSFKQENNDE